MSEINVPAESLPQMESAGVLSATDLMYILQGSGLDRDRSTTISAFLADQLVVNAINANEQWKNWVSVALNNNFGTWTKNVIWHLTNPDAGAETPFIVTSAQQDSILIILPAWGGQEVTQTFTFSINEQNYTVPYRHYIQLHFSHTAGVVTGAAVYPDTLAPKPNKVATCGTPFADDGYRGPQEIIVNPVLTDDDGVIMTELEIQCYSENAVMKITPDWRHAVLENSLLANVQSGGATTGVTIPYGCTAEIAYETDKVISNISVLLSQNYLIQTVNIKDGAVTEAKLGTASVTATKLGLNAVTKLKILDGAVTEAKLGNESVSTAKLKNGAATPSKISLTPGMDIALGATTFDVDTFFNPASYALGYPLFLCSSDDMSVAYTYATLSTTKTVTCNQFSGVLFVCVDAPTYGHQWRPIGNFNP